jgi:hypothetical protein
MRTPFVKVKLDDPAISKFQDNVDRTLQSINASVVVDSVLLEGVVLRRDQVNAVKHTLDRVPRGFHIVKSSCPTGIPGWVDATKQLLFLNSVSDVTVSALVF